MGRESVHRAAWAWRLAREQHGVVARRQLHELGYSKEAIEHRLATGRLHRLHAGVYAVGYPEVTRPGRWMAAVLACGRGALLSHGSAAALLGIDDRERAISISVPRGRTPRPPGVKVHRVVLEDGDAATRDHIPITSPARTLIDLAIDLSPARLERAVNQADKLGLIDPDELRAELSSRPGQRGVPALRDLLDRDSFALTASELERRFLRLARQAGLVRPETGVRLNGYVVDFYWRDLRLVVETDGLRYHRTAMQQARDRRRDQAHAAAGLTTLRFTHGQVVHETPSVQRTLSAVALKLTARSA